MSKNNKIKMLALDPSLSNCGWSILELDLTTGNTAVLKIGTISSKKIIKRNYDKDIVEKFGTTILSLEILQQKLREVIVANKPQYIITEDAFFNFRRPSAYPILLQCIITIQRLAYKEFDTVVYKVPTRSAKLTMTEHGGAKKSCVQENILIKDDIIFKNKKIMSSMSADEADSIAVGYHFIKKILPDILLTLGAAA